MLSSEQTILPQVPAQAKPLPPPDDEILEELKQAQEALRRLTARQMATLESQMSRMDADRVAVERKR